MVTKGQYFPHDSLHASALITNVVGLVAAIVIAWLVQAALLLGGLYPLKVVGLFAIVGLLAVFMLRESHPFARYGPANQITTARAVLIALVAGFIGETPFPGAAAWAAGLGLLVTVLDGLDGWCSRRSRMASAFGARFDMEMDALLILALALLVWQYDKAGGWVAFSGLLRYLFVAASWWWRWLRRPLPPSRRRQVICVIQMAALILAVWPGVTRPFSSALAALALGTLCFSFLIDTAWLWRQRGLTDTRWRRWFGLAAAVALLNTSLTFGNIWPTPAIAWRRELSIELAVSLLVLVAATRWIGPLSGTILKWLTALWALLVIGRYADVTALALYGRDLNLYWDLRYVPDVAAMLVRAASVWALSLLAATIVLGLFALFAVVHWAIGRLGRAMDDALERRFLTAVAAGMVAVFAGQQLSDRIPRVIEFSNPVLATYGRQIPLVMAALGGGSRSLAASPPMNSDLGLVKGADVVLMFIESYGAVSFEQPEFNARLTPSRSELDVAVRATGRDVVSAYVESPTFGGSSWLAHLSLMSGVEVRDPDTNARLMTQKRETLVTAFARQGYRTIAVMPGLWQRWPEGAFYGFDKIYGGEELDYRGPPFGWWSIPDQFAIAQMDALEVEPARRAPLFVFFPTVTTHAPFTPTPPYQPDWRRVLTDTPYEAADLQRVWIQEADWMNLGPSYIDALSYTYRALGGYLRMRADHDFVLILLGDHQPAAAVTGEGARWDVPVHVIASRRAILERLRARGFQSGLRPSGPALVKMHALLPVLLEVLGERHE